MAETVEIVINAKDNASKTFDGVSKSLGALGTAGGVAAKGIGLAVGGIGAIVGAAAAGAAAFTLYAGQATMTAARVDEMRIVNEVLAGNLGISNELIREQVAALREQGIEAGASEDALAKMMQANLDVAFATDLAVVAQDAAVISGENSTETYNRIIHGVTTLNPLVLRNAGLIVDQDAAYADLAESLDKTVTELTTAEKQQAMMNAVMEAGTGIVGAYDAAMENPIKQLGSMKRLFDDLSVSVGGNFLPGFSTVIAEFSTFVVWLREASEEGGVLHPILTLLGDNFENMAGNLGPALDLLQDFIGLGAEAVMALLSGETEEFAENIQVMADNLLVVLEEVLPNLVDIGMSIVETLMTAIIDALPIMLPVGVELISTLILAILEAAPLILEAALTLLTTLVQGMVDLLPDIIPAIIDLIFGIIELITDQAPEMIEAAAQIVEELADGLVDLLPELIPAIVELILFLVQTIVDNLDMLIKAAVEIMVALTDGIIDALPILIPAIAELVATILEVIIENLPLIIEASTEIMVALTEALVDNIDLLVDATITIIAALVEALADNLDKIIAAGMELMNHLVLGMLQYMPELLAQIPGIVQQISSGFSGMVGEFVAIGTAIGEGIYAGLQGLGGQIIEFFWGLIQAALDIFKVGSPSKVFYEIGQNIADGLLLGIDEGLDGGSALDSILGMAGGFAGLGSGFVKRIKNMHGGIDDIADKVKNLSDEEKVLVESIEMYADAIEEKQSLASELREAEDGAVELQKVLRDIVQLESMSVEENEKLAALREKIGMFSKEQERLEAFGERHKTAEQELNFLQEQVNLLAFIDEHELDRKAIIGDTMLGKEASARVLASAMTKSMEELANKLHWELTQEGGGGGWQGFASGGFFPANQPMLVGERGPELVYSRRPGYVMSNDDMLSSLGNREPSVTHNYYLTANYPKESEITLTERIKVMEALNA